MKADPFVEQVLALRLQGKSRERIAIELGCTFNRVRIAIQSARRRGDKRFNQHRNMPLTSSRNSAKGEYRPYEDRNIWSHADYLRMDAKFKRAMIRAHGLRFPLADGG